MKTFVEILHRRSLTFALVAFFLGAWAFAGAFSLGYPDGRWPENVASSAIAVAVLSVVSFTVCIHAWIVLLGDVNRGYSPARISLAAPVLMLGSFLSALALLGTLNCIVKWIA
jgi:hypothetical protein